jgi:O-antigen/teichoic acid export membrane protein
MRNFKLSPFLKDIVLTTITSIAVIISVIFVTRFLAKGLGPDGFGAYCLARRIVSFIIPFSTLSIGVSLARYVAISVDEEKRNDYLFSSVPIVLGPALLILLIGCLGSKRLTILIFHDPNYLNLFYASLFMVVGFGFFTVLYSYYRGIQRMDIANLWQVCIMAILPLIISYAFAQQGNVALIVFLIGLSNYITVFPLIVLLKRIKWRRLNQLKLSFKDLLRYGTPRTPGGIALAGILTIGPFLAPYFGTMKDAGYLVVGQSVFRIIEASVVAFGLVALPKVTQIFFEGRTNFLRNRISDILAMIIHLGLFAIIQIFIWSNEIVLIWLGNEYLEAVPIIKIFLVSLCPYLGYIMLRSIIDAVEERAINTLNLFISFGITALISLVLGYTGFGVLGLALGITIGLLSLGVSTTYFLVKRYRITFENMKLVWILIINCIFAGIAIFTKQYITTYFDNINLLIAIFLIEFSLFTIYLWLLYKKDTQWVMELKKRVFSNVV